MEKNSQKIDYKAKKVVLWTTVIGLLTAIIVFFTKYEPLFTTKPPSEKPELINIKGRLFVDGMGKGGIQLFFEEDPLYQFSTDPSGSFIAEGLEFSKKVKKLNLICPSKESILVYTSDLTNDRRIQIDEDWITLPPIRISDPCKGTTEVTRLPKEKYVSKTVIEATFDTVQLLFDAALSNNPIEVNREPARILERSGIHATVIVASNENHTFGIKYGDRYCDVSSFVTENKTITINLTDCK